MFHYQNTNFETELSCQCWFCTVCVCVSASLRGCCVCKGPSPAVPQGSERSFPEKTRDSLRCTWFRRSQSPVWLSATVPTLPVESLEVSLPQPPRLRPPIITHHTGWWSATSKLIKRIMCSKLIMRHKDYCKHCREDWQPLSASYETLFNCITALN